MAISFTQATPLVDAGGVLTIEGLTQLNALVEATGGVDGDLQLAASQIVSGEFADARISESSVTQHQAAIVLTSGQVSAAGALLASSVSSNITSFTLPASTTISTFGATLVDDASAGDARTTLGVEIGADVHRFLSVREETGTTATLAATDSVLIMTNAGANTVTIPAGLTGGPFWVFQGGAGATTVQGAASVDLNDVTTGTLAVSAQYSKVMVARRASNDWIGG